METLNHPAVLAELTACHESYERALVNNDVELLQHFFWDSPDAVRYGVGENLYGSAEIDAFRKARPNINLNRDILRLQIFTFDSVTGIVNLEFRRIANGTVRHRPPEPVLAEVPGRLEGSLRSYFVPAGNGRGRYSGFGRATHRPSSRSCPPPGSRRGIQPIKRRRGETH